MANTGSLTDRFGRLHTDLRVSVTDRCNLRCAYCMPAMGIPLASHTEILSFEEIRRFVTVAAKLGIHKVRLTGGEPLVRREIVRLVEMLAAVPGVTDLAMTTNGILLARYAEALKAAGLGRLNISLDALSCEKYRQISRRDELAQVLRGIEVACQLGFRQIKLNTLAVRGQTEDQVVPLARFARDHGLVLRFIEFMPLDGAHTWRPEQVLPGEEILRILQQHLGPLQPASPADPSAPATEYQSVDGGGRVGLIRSISAPFCEHCSRLRLTSDGRVRNCLFSAQEWDARPLLGLEPCDEPLAELIRNAVHAKRRGRGTDTGQFARPQRTMHQIGG